MVEPAFSPQSFREALGQFATGVTIVTARGPDGEPVGMTASSFNSVSIDPPLVLWSVTKSALSAEAFRTAEHYAIHVLATDQTDLSNRFARRGGDKFGETEFQDDENGVPILDGTSARYDCKAWAVYEGGDHWIIVGEVIGIENTRRPALVFGQGAYALSTPLDALSANLRDGVTPQNDIHDLFQFQISQIFHKMVVQFHDVITSNGLTVEQWRIGSSLSGVAGMEFDDLTVETHLTADQLQATLTDMQQTGLCLVQHDGDSRQIALTDLGQTVIQRLMGLAKQQEDNILSPLEGDQVLALKVALAKLIGPRN